MNRLANYSHTERFGNIGDLFKHSCLIEAFEVIARRKCSPGTYLDSHSGYARYKLSEHSGRLPGEQEWSLGVLLGQESWNSSGIRSLINYVRQHNTYPGSPALAMAFLPSDAELIFYDTCKDAADSIRDAGNDVRRIGRVRVEDADGFTGASKSLDGASAETSGLWIFLDPPYRGAAEHSDWSEVSEIFHKAAPTEASIVAWYPVKLRKPCFPPLNEIEAATERGISWASLWFPDAENWKKGPWCSHDLAGCGLLWVGLPELAVITERIGQELQRGFAGKLSDNGRKLDLKFSASWLSGRCAYGSGN